MAFLLSYIKGKKATVIGAGSSGLAVAQLLFQQSVKVFVSEKAPRKEREGAYHILRNATIPFELGEHSEQIFNADFWVLSPGINPEIELVQKALKRDISVFGELEVASWFCKAPIAAITGSNGKSTVTTLLGDVLKTSGRRHAVVGNIGRPFSGEVQQLQENDAAVVEVSSFQLETIRSFCPHVAVMLNLTPDHLDRHQSMEKYGEIKAQIFKNQKESDYIIYNNQDSLVSNLVQKAKSQRIGFGQEDKKRPCAFIRDGKLVVRLDREIEILPQSQMQIKGEHNAYNSMAAALAAHLMNVSIEDIRKAFRQFKGLPHRMETVREIHSVSWINDSKATNVDAVWYALESFNQPVILIAGGRDKDSDFTALREMVQEKCKLVISIGEAAEKLAKAFQGLNVKCVDSLEASVQTAYEQAQTGDVVLLSPACASFDMFKNFEDRGDQFKALVNNLN